MGGAAEFAAPAAAAWNLLHLAAKLFDDLEDGHPPTGSGRTLKELNPASALNAATALLFLAPLALHAPRQGIGPAQGQSFDRLRARRLAYGLHRTALRMCAGQHRDLTEMANPGFTTFALLSASLDDYWQVVGAKSGSFFAWAARAGAVPGGGTAAQVAACAGYRYNMGVLNSSCSVCDQIAQAIEEAAAGKKERYRIHLTRNWTHATLEMSIVVALSS